MANEVKPISFPAGYYSQLNGGINVIKSEYLVDTYIAGRIFLFYIITFCYFRGFPPVGFFKFFYFLRIVII